MRRALVWIRNGLLALIPLAMLLIGSVYLVSEMRMRHSFTVNAPEITVPQGASIIAEGERLVVARGCAGCHGGNLAGSKMIEPPLLGRVYGANLTRGRGGVGRSTRQPRSPAPFATASPPTVAPC